MTIRTIIRIFHILSGLFAFVTIARFIGLTTWSELIGNAAQIASVKIWIVSRLPMLIVSFIIVGASGYILTGGKPRGLAAKKLQRMKIIAPNGIFILIPAALFLRWKAGNAELDSAFYTVQMIEIIAGTVNLILLGMSMRDGLKMRGRFKQIKTLFLK